MKSKFFWGSAILCCVLGLGTVSCSDDDDKEFSIEETYTKDGITTQYDGGIYKIKVKGNSEWVATVPDGNEWINLVVNKGKGNEELVILVEQSYDGSGRNADVTVTSGSDKLVIPVRQVANRDNAMDGFSTITNKGLGYGFDPKNYTRGTYSILNLKAIDAVKATDDIMYGNLISETRLPELKALDANVDSLEDKSDTLNIKLSCDISYGTFKLGISGGLHSHEHRVTKARVINVAAKYPMYEASFDLSAVMDVYKEWVEEGMPKKLADGTPDYRGYMINKSIMSKIETLEKEVTSKKVNNFKDDASIENRCRDLVNQLGPCFMSRATLGGSYDMHFILDSINTNQTFRMDSAKVTAEIKTGLFQLKAGVSAEYKKHMTEILKHGNYDAIIKGGGTNEQEAVYAQFKKEDHDCSEQVRLWVNSLKLEKDPNVSNVTLVSCDLMPIWSLLGENSKKIMVQYIASISEWKNNDIIGLMLRKEGVSFD